jgi:hypothetical protein
MGCWCLPLSPFRRPWWRQTCIHWRSNGSTYIATGPIVSNTPHAGPCANAASRPSCHLLPVKRHRFVTFFRTSTKLTFGHHNAFAGYPACGSWLNQVGDLDAVRISDLKHNSSAESEKLNICPPGSGRIFQYICKAADLLNGVEISTWHSAGHTMDRYWDDSDC